MVRLNKAKIVQKFEFAPNRSKLAHKTSGATYARVERGRNFFFVRISPQRSPGPIQMKFGTFGHFCTERIGPMTQTRSVKRSLSSHQVNYWQTLFWLGGCEISTRLDQRLLRVNYSKMATKHLPCQTNLSSN